MNPTQNDQALSDQAALLSYVDDLIRDRKDPNVNETNKVQVQQLLLKEVNDEINLHLVNLLTEEDQKTLNDLLDKNVSDEELSKFFASKIPSLESEIAAVLLNFRATYLLPVTQTQSQTADLPPQTSTDTLPPLPPAPVPDEPAK
jgi:hypothetical protein